jgi:hypothetical protein
LSINNITGVDIGHLSSMILGNSVLRWSRKLFLKEVVRDNTIVRNCLYIFYLTIICWRRCDYQEYSPIITEPEANNCFSIFKSFVFFWYWTYFNLFISKLAQNG